MKLETLLPIGKVDPGLREPGTPFDLHTVGEQAALVERLGYDKLMFEETKHDPFAVLALAAQATTRVGIGTAVAIAFPRSPTVTAMSAWTLQKLSRGRFTLGLGTQVRGHIQRRYGMRWSAPGPWMREYVQALRAVWQAWQHGEQPRFAGEHYTIDLTVPLFDPGPIDDPAIPVHLAAVNPYLCEVAGEVADGVRPHPVCTADYIREVMWPAVRRGAARAGRPLADFAVSIKPLIATAPDERALAEKVRDVRARVAFYASTPAYRAAFAAHGLGELADELKHLSRAQRWEEMPAYISDEVLHTYACVGTYDEIAGVLAARYGGLVTDVEFSIPVANDADAAILAGMIETLRAA
ncbi:MAG: TIGR03617 family F420-dependent LLM class oxidoreductase [Gammaproteobacteria bacterium]